MTEKKQSNEPKPLVMEPEDRERELIQRINAQTVYIQAAIDYLKSGEPHRAHLALERAKL